MTSSHSEGRFPHGLKWLHEHVGGSQGMGNFIQHMGKWRADTVYAEVTTLALILLWQHLFSNAALPAF